MQTARVSRTRNRPPGFALQSWPPCCECVPGTHPSADTQPQHKHALQQHPNHRLARFQRGVHLRHGEGVFTPDNPQRVLCAGKGHIHALRVVQESNGSTASATTSHRRSRPASSNARHCFRSQCVNRGQKPHRHRNCHSRMMTSRS
jgi:hypothetical protein